jgi:hypothetical protein
MEIIKSSWAKKENIDSEASALSILKKRTATGLQFKWESR